MQRLYGLADLAQALGRSRTSTWYLVQAIIEAEARGQTGPAHLSPAAYVLKGVRTEVLFSAEQISSARRAYEQLIAGSGCGSSPNPRGRG